MSCNPCDAAILLFSCHLLCVCLKASKRWNYWICVFNVAALISIFISAIDQIQIIYHISYIYNSVTSNNKYGVQLALGQHHTLTDKIFKPLPCLIKQLTTIRALKTSNYLIKHISPFRNIMLQPFHINIAQDVTVTHHIIIIIII